MRPRPFVGTAVDAQALVSDAAYGVVLARSFDQVTAENALKWQALRPSPIAFDFAEADRVVDFAKAHGQRIRGHTLLWDQYLPAWITTRTWTRDELIEVLRRHIHTVMGHWKGAIAEWDVVNEVLLPSGALKPGLWLSVIGPDYLDLAFEFAHDADPAAKLFLNEDNSDTGTKFEALLELVTRLRDRRVPIDGVGLQTHTTTVPPPANAGSLPIPSALFTPDWSAFGRNLGRLGTAGFDVAITELDVRLKESTPDARKLQAETYAKVTQACVAEPRCTDLVVWGFDEGHSWVPAFFAGWGWATLYDDALRPTPAVAATREALVGSGSRFLAS